MFFVYSFRFCKGGWVGYTKNRKSSTKMFVPIVGVFLIFALISPSKCTPASAHLHNRDLNSERVEHGSYIHRDHNHISEDGEHNVNFDHEAILGSAKEAEEFDQLSPEEAKRRLAILVKKIDLNGDGQVERNELKAWIIRSFKSLSEEDAQERFEDMDEDENKRVTWKEYLNDYVENPEDDTSDQLLGDDKEMFQAADVNKDDELEFEEFVIFNHPEEHPETLPIILKHTLRDKDTNKDGFIDFQEFVGSRGYNEDKDWVVTEKERFEKEFDKNSDGKLDTDEILSWVVPSNEEIAGDEVDHLFASSDDDHDNVLSLQEILDHHDIFVGSEATDYGEHLNRMERDEL